MTFLALFLVFWATLAGLIGLTAHSAPKIAENDDRVVPWSDVLKERNWTARPPMQGGRDALLERAPVSQIKRRRGPIEIDGFDASEDVITLFCDPGVPKPRLRVVTECTSGQTIIHADNQPVAVIRDTDGQFSLRHVVMARRAA